MGYNRLLVLPRLAKISHFLVALVVFALTSPGLEYRFLWQDELDTAERARTICESGVPRVIDESGMASVSVGGREIEDGDLHRYQPWMMFYTAAAGLCFAEQLGMNRDGAARLPNVVLHAAASGLASWTLASSGGVPIVVANLTGLALGAQSVRVSHNRTVRYHSVLDLLVVLAMAGLGGIRRHKEWGWVLLSLSLFLLPQTHSISGSAFSLSLGFFAAVILAQSLDWRSSEYRRRVFLWVIFPGLFSLITLLVLSRPWAQSWGLDWQLPGITGVRDFNGILYAFLFPLFLGIWAWRRGGDRHLGKLYVGCWSFLLVAVMLVDVHSFTRPRYFLSITLIAFLWTAAFGLGSVSARAKRVIPLIVLLLALAPELGLGRVVMSGETAFYPFQGIRLVQDDARKERGGFQQPLHEAISWLRDNAAPDDPILFDYAPQFVYWYLPERPVALMPDLFFRQGLNYDHEIWSRPIEMPRWHLWYPEFGSGIWDCMDEGCDYDAVDYDPATHRYTLRSKRLGVEVAMCPVRTWATHPWNNSPFKNLEPAAFRPEGDDSGYLLMAAPCARR